MKRNIVLWGLIIGMSITSLSGCSNKEVKGLENLVEETESEDGYATMEELKSGSRWEEKWEVTLSDGTKKNVQINADIQVPAGNQMSVVEVQEVEFTKEVKEQFIRNYFPKGEVYLYDGKTNSYGESETSSEEEKEWILAEDYSGNSYWVISEGKEYIVTFEERKTSRERYRTASIQAVNLGEFSHENVKNMTNLRYRAPFYFEEVSENVTSISEEEAKEMALGAINQLGLSDMNLGSIEDVAWLSDEAFLTTNIKGYCVTLGTGIDNHPFYTDGLAWDYRAADILKEGQAPYHLDSNVSIYLTEEGIYDLCWESPVEITNVTKDVKLLPLEKIKEIVKEELTVNYTKYATNIYNNLDDFSLIYFRVVDKEKKGAYTYVPAWRICGMENDGGNETMKRPLVVNAIDGSIIDIAEALGN